MGGATHHAQKPTHHAQTPTHHTQHAHGWVGVPKMKDFDIITKCVSLVGGYMYSDT